MELTDTHCHIFLPEFDNDRAEVIDRAIGNGVTRFFLPNVDISTAGGLLEVADRWPMNCFPMMGLHPTSVNGDYEKELAGIEKCLDTSTFFGIGEVGIDLYWDQAWLDQQVEAFIVQLGWAANRNLPVIIHVRNSYNETINTILRLGLSGLRGIFHCFTGNLDQAKEVIGMGFFLGIGGVATFKNGGLDKVLPHVDPGNIVLETDSPYLAPVPHRGKRNEPSFLTLIAIRVAEIYGTSPEKIAQLTTHNSKTLFGV